jgi:hypothetical protein
MGLLGRIFTNILGENMFKWFIEKVKLYFQNWVHALEDHPVLLGY